MLQSGPSKRGDVHRMWRVNDNGSNDKRTEWEPQRRRRRHKTQQHNNYPFNLYEMCMYKYFLCQTKFLSLSCAHRVYAIMCFVISFALTAVRTAQTVCVLTLHVTAPLITSYIEANFTNTITLTLTLTRVVSHTACCCCRSIYMQQNTMSSSMHWIKWLWKIGMCWTFGVFMRSRIFSVW